MLNIPAEHGSASRQNAENDQAACSRWKLSLLQSSASRQRPNRDMPHTMPFSGRPQPSLLARWAEALRGTAS